MNSPRVVCYTLCVGLLLLLLPFRGHAHTATVKTSSVRHPSFPAKPMDNTELTPELWRWLNFVLSEKCKLVQAYLATRSRIEAGQVVADSLAVLARVQAKRRRKIGRGKCVCEDLLDEVIAMDTSSQRYDIVYDTAQWIDTTREHAAVYYSLLENSLVIFLAHPRESVGKKPLMAHELVHAFQFEAGTTSVQTYWSYPGDIKPVSFFLSDIPDEQAAYRRQCAFDPQHDESEWIAFQLNFYYRQQRLAGKRMPESQGTIQDYQHCTPQELQRLANDTRHAFRIGEVTYVPQLSDGQVASR